MASPGNSYSCCESIGKLAKDRRGSTHDSYKSGTKIPCASVSFCCVASPQRLVAKNDKHCASRSCGLAGPSCSRLTGLGLVGLGWPHSKVLCWAGWDARSLSPDASSYRAKHTEAKVFPAARNLEQKLQISLNPRLRTYTQPHFC